MDNNDFGAPLKEAIESLRIYLDQQLDYNKLLLGKKMGELSSYIILFIILGFLSTLILIFASFGFVWWFNDKFDWQPHFGYLIVTSFYAIMATLIFVFRNQLLFTPIRKLMGSILYADEDEENDETVNFNSLELLNHKIQKSKSKLRDQEEVLKDQLNNLGSEYTFTSISQRLIKNAYQSVMTTSNVARFTYLMVQRLKSGKKKKNTEIPPPQIEE